MFRTEGMVHIPEEAFPYLAVQRGGISDLISDRPKWNEAYMDSLWRDFDHLEPHLPAKCDALLDVGGGMSGISILLSRYYAQRQVHKPHVYVLDGDEDAPVVVRHARTFNNHKVGRRFLQSNGVVDFTGITPACEVRPPPGCDLIISLQSWCFHYNPETYLEYVLLCARRSCRLIIDVRKDYKTWRRILNDAFTFKEVLHEGAKSERCLFSA